MDVILIPGFWLDGSSWAEVTPAVERAGHRARALTLPGMESRAADRSTITLRDHVDAVVAAIDALDPADGPVALVGHSGGGAVAHGAVDARPERVARVVYVDSGPLGEGGVINDRLPVVNGEIPLPDWEEFEVIACEFPSETLRGWVQNGHPYVRELALIRDVTSVDLPTGHWPQFTRSAELGEVIVAALS